MQVITTTASDGNVVLAAEAMSAIPRLADREGIEQRLREELRRALTAYTNADPAQRESARLCHLKALRAFSDYVLKNRPPTE